MASMLNHLVFQSINQLIQLQTTRNHVKHTWIFHLSTFGISSQGHCSVLDGEQGNFALLSGFPDGIWLLFAPFRCRFTEKKAREGQLNEKQERWQVTLREVSKIAVNCQRLNHCCHIPARPLQISAPGVCASMCDLLECVTAALCNDVTQGTSHIPESSGVLLKQLSFPSPSTHTHLHMYTHMSVCVQFPRFLSYSEAN